MLDIKSRLSLGMTSSILLHSLLVILVFQLTMDQQKTEMVEVAYYGEGGGEGLVEGEETAVGMSSPSENAAWEQAQAGSPEGEPEVTTEPVPVPTPSPVPPVESAKPEPLEKVSPTPPTIAEAPKPETKPVAMPIEIKKAAAPKAPEPRASRPTAMLDRATPEDAETEAMIAAAKADFESATAQAREEMTAQVRATEQRESSPESMATVTESRPLPPVNPTSDEVQQSLAAAEAALRRQDNATSAAPAPATLMGSSGGEGAALNSTAPGQGGGGDVQGDGFVRDLSQLRQMPGNPKPQYDVEERLNRHEGTVIFHALISTEGLPVNIKIIQGSGFRGLDKKAYAALKKWRFYPGQQGWVEVPINWSLQGDPQEIAPLQREGE